MIVSIKQFFQKEETKNTLTLYGNHLLLICMFFAPIYKKPITVALAVLFIMFLLRGDYKFYLKESISNKIVQAGIIIFLVHAVWMIGSDNIKFGKYMLENSRYFLFPIIILFFADSSFSKKFLMAFIFGMLFSEMLSYMIHFDIIPHTFEIFGKIVYEAQGVDNPTPFLVHYEYNTLLSLVVGVLLYNLLANKNRLFVKLASMFFITTASINMVLVGGRIGYVAYIVVILTTLFLIYRKNFFKIALPIALLAIGIFYFTAYNSGGLFKQRVDNIVSDFEKIQENDIKSSIGYRLAMWKYGVDVLKDNWLFGVGTGDVMQSIHEVAINKDIKAMQHHPHNVYIEYFVEFGIIGLLALLNLFYQNYKIKVEDRSLKIYLYIVNLSFMIYITTNEFPRNMILIFMLLVLGLSSKNKYLKNENLRYTKNIKIFYIVSVVLFIIIGIM